MGERAGYRLPGRENQATKDDGRSWKKRKQQEERRKKKERKKRLAAGWECRVWHPLRLLSLVGLIASPLHAVDCCLIVIISLLISTVFLLFTVALYVPISKHIFSIYTYSSTPGRLLYYIMYINVCTPICIQSLLKKIFFNVFIFVVHI